MPLHPWSGVLGRRSRIFSETLAWFHSSVHVLQGGDLSTCFCCLCTWRMFNDINSFFYYFFHSPPPSPQSLRKVGQDSTVLLICITVFLSYLPEAGQYSSFFLYLRQVSLLRRGAAVHRQIQPTNITLVVCPEGANHGQ